MADGSVKIDIKVDDKDANKKLDGLADEAEDAGEAMEDLGDSSEKTGGGFDLAGAAAKGLAAGGMMAIVSAAGEALGSLMALAEETREYREDMAKLKTAFTTTGHSAEDAQEAYDGFYKLLGESDRTVEAVNHLAELTTNTAELADWQTIAAGVTAKFGDSLPIEGLTEAANETAKVGAVTGPLADALNWAGISEDEFNKKLAACNSEQERATLITSTLNAEYDEAAAEYNALTAETQAARDATNRMEQAQADLGAAVEPLSTWWTNAKASLMEFAAETVTRLREVVEGNHLLTESENAIYEATMAAAEAYRAKKEAIHEAALAQTADIDYAANVLVPQLQAIVDANGQVKQGYEERANYLIGQMNEAWGTEYTNISQIIGANGQLKESIIESINAKKAQILLEAHEEDYKNAVLNITQAEEARLQMLKLVAAKQAKLTEAQQKEQAIIDEMNESIKKYGAAGAVGYGERMDAASLAIEREEKDLNKLMAKFEEVDAAYKEYNEDIAVYDTAKTMVLEGNTEKAIGYLNQVNAGYGTQLGVVQATDKDLRKAADDRLTNAALNYKLLLDEYDKGEKSMTGAQKTQMEARIAAAEAEVESAYEEAKKLGSNLVEGIGVGADGKKDWLSGKLGNIVSAGIEAAKKAGIIKSPSRKMRDEVGIPLVQGIAVGIEKAAKEPINAMESVVEDVIKTGGENGGKIAEFGRALALGIAKGIRNNSKEPTKELKAIVEDLEEYLEEEQKKSIKTIKDYNADIKALETKRNDDIAELDKKLVEDKKKENADIEELEKQHTKAIENINEQHADKVQAINDNIKKIISDKMREIVDLGNTYKDEVKTLWEDLDNSITSLQQEYDNQLASRTESIASSLGLWSEAKIESPRATELTNNLKSQVRALERYNAAIENLEGRGLDEAFINQLKGLGVGSVGEIETLSRMSDERLQDYVELWEKKNKLAHDAALEELEPLKAETEKKIDELKGAAKTKYEEMRAEFEAQGGLLAEELKQAMTESGLDGYEAIIEQIDDYKEAGVGLMDGVAEGIIQESPILARVAATAIERALNAAKRAAGISTSSDADFPTLQNSMRNAVNAETSRMSQGVGTNNADTSAIADAIRLQTAGINSLASEYRRGSTTQVTVPLVLDGRELGRAIVELGNEENARVGTNLATT